MKIQCSCGAKYVFDITPDMAQLPVRFVCQNCGLDSSDFVNELVRRELASGISAPAPVPAVTSSPPQEAPVPETASRLRISRPQQPSVPAAGTGEAAPGFCLKHNQLATDRCRVCQKPICPKCMELFGYVCSPFCKAKAEAQKIAVPVFAGQRSVVEAHFWRKTGKISAAIGAVIVAAFGFWFWYAWFGSVPKPVFSIRFDERAYSGHSVLCQTNQLVFLHGDTLGRCDLKSEKEVWSAQLITRQQILEAVGGEERNQRSLNGKVVTKNSQTTPDEKTIQLMEREMAAELNLIVSGQNIWVGKPVARMDKGDSWPHYDYQLTRYDWDSGRALKEITIPEERGEMIQREDELLLLKQTGVGAQFVTHVSLADGATREEEFHEPGAIMVASAKNPTARLAGVGEPATGGLPLSPNADPDKPLDPQKVAQQVQSLPLPARIALPATLANVQHQQQIQKELKDDDAPNSKPAAPPQEKVAEHFELIPGKYGFVQFSVHLLEERIVTREAMKARPKKSALNDANLNDTKTADVANEILNEMQRNNGGGTVEDDESRYQVAIRLPDSKEIADWTGEVIGPPSLSPLKTVNVLAAGKTLTVFDKSNKKLWQSTLSYSVPEFAGIFGEEKMPYGEGPCVERGDSLYVFDQAVLTAFDLATGNVRWRLPAVGTVGLFFDDKGMLYVNTTTASPENIKYSRQIDVTQKTDAVVLKIDPKTGRTLWNVKPGGFVSYLSGKFIYLFYAQDPGEEENALSLAGIAPPPAFMKIRRISPKDGHVLWDYQEDRAPLDVRFHDNSIYLVFKKELQVLRFLSL